MVGFISILWVVSLYGLIHSLLASLTFKAKVRQWFGRSTERWYRLAYNLFATISFVLVLALVIGLPDQLLYIIREPWACITLALQLFAVIALVVGVLQTGALSFIGLRQLIDPTEPQPSRLVATGLYRSVRHPLYTAGLVLLWLFPVMTLNLLALNIALTIYIFIGAYLEERRLLAEFGETYAAYRQSTPMLLPRIRH